MSPAHLNNRERNHRQPSARGAGGEAAAAGAARQARATAGFDAPLVRQMQVDFGERLVKIDARSTEPEHPVHGRRPRPYLDLGEL
jgi:hypothetical protein